MTDVLGADGLEVDHLTYDTYGDVVAQTSPAERPRFGFQGMAFDQAATGAAGGNADVAAGADTGMYYDNARFYDPGTGRFLNQDPSGYKGGDVDLYRFAGNDPTGATDPTGLSENHYGTDVTSQIGYQPYTIAGTLPQNGNTWSLASAPVPSSTGWSGITSSSTSTDANGLPVSNLSVQSMPGSGPAGYNLSPIPSNFSYVQLSTGNLTPAATLNATAAFANASQNMEATAWANSAGYAQMNRSLVEKSLDQFFDESPTEMALQFGQAALPLVIPEEGVAVAAEELLGEESAVAAVDYTADIGVAAKTIGTDSTLGAVAEGEAAPAAAENTAAGSLEEATALQARAQELNGLRDSWMAQRGTTAAVNVQNVNTGEIQTWLATESPGAMPGEWNGLLGDGEVFKAGPGHAEQTIVNALGDDWVITSGGSSRNVCIGTCQPLLEGQGLQLGGPTFRGMADKTPYRMFWSQP